MKKNRRIKILKTIEVYFLALSYMFIGFFIGMTGIHILPEVARVAREGSIAPFFYSLSIILGFIYFFYYKVYKIINSKDED